MGRPGLDPGTNPESFRGCSLTADFKIEIASRGFFFCLRVCSSLRASTIDESSFAITSSIRLPNRRVVVIATTLVLGHSPLKVFRRADVITAIATQNVYPGHKRLGRPGLEPGTNAIKGRCSTD